MTTTSLFRCIWLGPTARKRREQPSITHAVKSKSFSQRNPMSTRLWLVLVVAVLLGRQLSADEDSAAELKRIEGCFERKFQNAAGTTFRVLREVAGDQSRVTTWDDIGNVVESHTSTIKAE